MSAEPYFIPSGRQRETITIANSRFIATADRAETVDDAKAILAGIRQEMPDANHHVYAFRVGFGSAVTEGMSDDGEPSGTSGPPVLAVVRGSNIGDLIVVVTRYFGGTKLGTGGLVQAYTQAAKTVLAALKTELKLTYTVASMNLPYSLYERVKRLVATHNGEALSEDFAEQVTIQARFPENDFDGFKRALIELSAGNVVPVLLDS